MTNPVLVEVTRSGRVESMHRGAVAVVHRSGELRASLGDVETRIYPRSSLKPIQALPLVESGAADAFGLSGENIALACASHSGEPMHTERIGAWLTRLGLGEADLACGAHPVRYEPVWHAMIVRGEHPSRIHNNCSGKHTGFLTVARHWDVATAGYEQVDHPVQRAVAATLGELAGESDLPWGIDGCTAPNFALSLKAFATALARLAAPEGLAPPRAQAAQRVVSSMIRYPELVSGTGRACALLMRASAGLVAVKAGAEGVYAAIVPSLKLGVAIKIDDGAGRAAETAIASVLRSLGVLNAATPAESLLRAPVINTVGTVVGDRHPSEILSNLRVS